MTGVTAGSFSSTIGYDGFGRRNSVSHSSGESGSFQHDLLSRLTQVTWTGPMPISESLIYDPLTGNPTSITRENGAYSVAYDAIDQLTSSTGAYNHSLTYDALGNREQSSVNGAGTFVNNFLVSNGQSTFRADPNGFGETVRETTGSTVKNYLYRVDGRMSEFESGSTQASYYYDALGRRVGKAINTGSGLFNQSFLHLGTEDRILMAKAGDGALTTYIDGQGVDEHIAEVKNGVGKGYVSDHLGSVLNGDAAGANHSFGLFGETGILTVSAASNPVQYGFAGREYDSESENYYSRRRIFSSISGRFLTQDPAGIAANDSNYYRYVFNNPQMLTDPFGLKVVDTTGITSSPAFTNNLTAYSLFLRLDKSSQLVRVTFGQSEGSGGAQANPIRRGEGGETSIVINDKQVSSNEYVRALYHEMLHAEQNQNNVDPGSKGSEAEARAREIAEFGRREGGVCGRVGSSDAYNFY